MKKLIYLFLGLFLLVANVGCSSDDDDPQLDSIVGVWQFNSSKVSFSFQGKKHSESVPFTACMKESTITFREDGTGQGYIKSDDSGPCQVVQDEEFTYSYDAKLKKLIENSDGLSVSYTVKSITSNELVIQMRMEDYADFVPELEEILSMGVTDAIVEITCKKVSK